MSPTARIQRGSMAVFALPAAGLLRLSAATRIPSREAFSDLYK